MGETRAEYWERKREELALLREAAADESAAGPPLSRVATVEELVREKLRLRARLLARAFAETPLVTESNLAGDGRSPLGPPLACLGEAPAATARATADDRAASSPGNGPALVWNYQRFDARLRLRPFHHVAYAGLATRAPFLSLGLLASSGMAALYAALVAVDTPPDPPSDPSPAPSPGDSSTGKRRIRFPDDAYFETLQLADRQLRHLAPARAPRGRAVEDAPGDVLFLDSIAERDPTARLAADDLRPLAAVVYDTTCHAGDAVEIARAVDACAAAGVPLLLARSHVKLDQLGTEHFRLGSIVLTLPVRPPPSLVARARRLRQRLRDALAQTGGQFVPQALFPLAVDERFAPRFRRLSSLRTRRLVENNRAAAAALVAASRPTSIRGYHHGCFLVAAPLLDGAHYVSESLRAAQSRLAAASLTARLAPSFAYDFVGLSKVADPSGAHHAARVALPDLCDEDLARAVDTLGAWAASLLPTP